MAAPQQEERPCPTCGVSPNHLRELNDKIEELGREIAELKRRLSLYENSNSPPSKNSLLYREMRRNRRSEEEGGPAPRKPGRKEGHQGVTQVFKSTGRVVHHTMERCPRCGSTHLSVVSTERRTVVDVPEPLPYTVREHAVNTYRRPGCGADDLAPDSVGRGSPRPWRRRGTAASCSGRIRSPRCLRSGPWRGSP